MKLNMFSYQKLDSPIHRLTGLTKLLGFLLISLAVMFSYDIRYVSFVFIFSILVFKMAKLKLSDVKIILLYVIVFIIVNMIFTYIFAPEYGVEIFGTRNELFTIYGRYTMTKEQILYMTTKAIKYIAVIPIGIVFFFTTNPSEFASSLNRIGVPSKAAYAVGLTLRYFPDIQRDYTEISLSQQARGLELSSKSKFLDRVKNYLLIIIPLIFSSIDRVETIGDAMDLRGFGKHKKRTWYTKENLKKADYIALFISILVTVLGFYMIYQNGSRFYNIFI